MALSLKFLIANFFVINVGFLIVDTFVLNINMRSLVANSSVLHIKKILLRSLIICTQEINLPL